MSVIAMTFDTETKAMAVTVDGEPVSDVVEMWCHRRYSDDKGYGLAITTSTEDKEQKLTRMTRLVAARSQEAKPTMAAAPVPGFVVASERDSVEDSVARYFGCK